MRIYKIAALILCAAMAVSAAAGCSDDSGSRSMSVTSQSTTVNQNNEGRADHEVSAAVSEKASANKTGFTLNRVIDAGNRSENNERFIYLDVTIDNTTDEELDALLRAYLEIQPREVMLYAIDRKTPAENLEKVSKEELQRIAERFREAGIQVQVNA